MSVYCGVTACLQCYRLSKIRRAKLSISGKQRVEARPGWDIRPYITISPPANFTQQAAVDVFLHLHINLFQTREHFRFDLETYHIRNRGLFRLPPELVSMIISFITSAASKPNYPFHGSLRETFTRCALVCRDWSAIFRRLHLETINVTRAFQFGRLYDIFVLSPTPHYHGAAFVRTLSVDASHTSSPCLELILASALPKKFVNLVEIHSTSPSGTYSISKMPPRVPPHVQLALPALLRPLQRLTHLRMTGTRFRSFGQLVSIIRAVQAPSHISLDDVTFSRQGPVRPAFLAAARARLQQLSFRSTLLPLDITTAFPVAELMTGHYVLQLVGTTADDTTAIISTFEVLVRLFQNLHYRESVQESVALSYVSLELQVHKHHEGKSLLLQRLDFCSDIILSYQR